jgi:hypothetical protein
VGTIAGTRPYHIATKQPFIGSANSTFKFAEDGTMTEATANVTDDTAKTVLSWFPITAKLTEQWGLAAADNKTADAKALGEYRTYGLPLDRPRPQQLRKIVNVDLTATTASMIYTLRKVVPVVDGESVRAREPLRLCDALKGSDGVELVSVAPAGTPKAKEETVDETKKGEKRKKDQANDGAPKE